LAGLGVARFFFFQENEMAKSKEANGSAVGGQAPTNGAEQAIEYGHPYTATVILEGTADLLFHRWNCEGVEAKANAAKGSKAKKTDDVESYLYRDKDENICLPGEYIRQAIIHAAKFKQDPRSPRKSAMDLFKAAVVSLTVNASLGKTAPDYLHKCRVQVQRNGITRVRPAIMSGWIAEFQLTCLLPEYVSPQLLQDVMTQAGKLIGVGDFRPTYGRFSVKSFDIGFES
jgi:hypothetical protein